MEETTQNNLFELQVDHQSSLYLGETAKWTKFLSIVGFICCGLLVIVAFFAGSILASSGMGRYGGTLGSVGIAIIYCLIALLYFFPCLYLFHFSTKMQLALRNNDQQQLADSFKNLKSCFKYMGILTIIVLAFYIIVFIIGVVAASSVRV